MDALNWIPRGLREKMPPEVLNGEYQMNWGEPEKVETYNREPGPLTGFDCPECRNKGFIMFLDEMGQRRLRECSCQAKRRSLRLIEKSGLAPLLTRYTFERWQVVEPWQRRLLEGAQSYAAAPTGWFFVSGPSGSGKTHICTAVSATLLDAGIELRYVVWRDFAAQAKSAVTDGERYAALLDPLKRVDVLYLDDFLKVRRGEKPTTGDVNLAFELLNARYNAGLRTILSTEHSAHFLMELDEALGSRIVEMARCHIYEIPASAENWRLRA